MTDNKKLLRAASSLHTSTASFTKFANVDMFDVDIDDYHELVKACRFYYKKDPIIASVINRLSDMASNGLIIERGNLRKNEFAAIEAIIPNLLEFTRVAVREALISGLVFPEVDFKKYTKKELRILGVKNYPSLTLPYRMWIRNPDNIVLKEGIHGSDVRYFLKLPKQFIYFVQNKGKYEDGKEDKNLYERIKKDFPDIVDAVQKGETEVEITPRYHVIRREVHPDSPYPEPYLTPIIEYAAYKRNLRRMDYATASRVITAIMLVKLGNDQYPLTEDDADAFDDIEQQLRAQSSIASTSTGDITFERIIQLFADHTLQIEWVYPPIDTLLNEKKYDPINQEILLGLGFPTSAIIGESLRANARSDTAMAKIPQIILNPIRNQILFIIRQVIYDIINMNRFRGEPGDIRFEPISVDSVKDLLAMIQFLYDSGSLSRQTSLKAFGFDFFSEMEKRKEEEKILSRFGLTAFPPTPHSNEPPPPDQNNQNNDSGGND